MASRDGYPVVWSSGQRAWRLLKQGRDFYLMVAGSGRYFVQSGLAWPDSFPGPARQVEELLDPAKRI